MHISSKRYSPTFEKNSRHKAYKAESISPHPKSKDDGRPKGEVVLRGRLKSPISQRHGADNRLYCWKGVCGLDRRTDVGKQASL